MGDVSRVLVKNVTRDGEKETITIDQKGSAEDGSSRLGYRSAVPPLHQERDQSVRSTNRRKVCWTRKANGGTCQPYELGQPRLR